MFKDNILEKYFYSLDVFNKDIIELKSNIIKDYDYFSYKNLLSTLGFNTYTNSVNYKWGKRYFNRNLKSFSWITTNSDKTITVPSYDVIEHTSCTKTFIPYLNQKDFSNHVCSSLSKKQPFVFTEKPKINSILYNIEKEELSNYKLATININKINNKTFGTSQVSNSNVLWLDIDNRNGQIATKTFEQVCKILKIKNYNILYMEQNLFSGGLHVMIKLSNNITDNSLYSKLEKKFKELNLHVECDFQNKILRLPLSFEYIPIKTNKRIDLSNEFISSSYYVDSIKTFDIENKKSLDISIITNFISSTENAWENYWKSKRTLFVRNKQAKKKYQINDITIGERWNNTKKIVPFCKAVLGYSLEETAIAIKQHNVSSKDLSNWSVSQIENNIKSFYNKCPDTYVEKVKNYSGGLISNIYLLDKHIISMFNNKKIVNMIVKQTEHYYLKERNKHHTNMKHISKEKRDIWEIQLPEYYKEIFGKMNYDIKTEKRFINDRFGYMNGFQLSDEHLLAIQEDVNKRFGLTGRLSKNNIQYLKKAIISVLGLEEIQSNCKNKRNWILGSCKSYNIKNALDITKVINKLFKLAINKIILNNSFIYNISIGQGIKLLENNYLMEKVVPIPIKNTC